MQRKPEYTFDIIIRSEAKRKKYFAGVSLIVEDARKAGDYETAAAWAKKKKQVQEMIELITT